MSQSSLFCLDLDADREPSVPAGLSEMVYAAWRGCLVEIRRSEKPEEA
jgi:hypothetical protein